MTTDLTTTTVHDVIRTNAQGVAQFTEQGAALVTKMLCEHASKIEMAFFASYCKRLNLDPFSGHVHLVQRGTSGNKVCRPELSISGALLIAERSGKYRGRTDYQWCGDDGVWTDVWLERTPPRAARVGVYRDGAEHPIYAVALWDSYVGTKFNGEVNSMWLKHGPRMLAKCALRLALGDALPAELGGVYITEEMGQADNVEARREVVAEVVDAAEMLDDRHAAILTAVMGVAGHEFDAADKLAEDFPRHLDAALRISGIDPATCEDIVTAALDGAPVDDVLALINGAVPA